MDKLAALNVFAEVAERGSFTKAGKSLGLTRSMVSRYVNDLETWLGTRLLQRSTRKLSLTQAGKDCLIRARELVDLSTVLQEEVGGQSQKPQGTLRITCAISFGNLVLVPLIGEFLKLHENIDIELVLTDRSTHLVREGIDLALTMTNDLDPSCIAHPLSSCHSVVTASPDYLDKHGPIEELAALKHHNCLRHAHYGTHSWSFEHEGEKTSVAVDGRFVVNDALAIGHAAVQGMGVALLPSYVATPLINAGKLSIVCARYSAAPIGIYGVYRSRVHIPATLKQLLGFLRTRLGSAL